MEPKLTKTAKVSLDERVTPDNLQRALDLLWTLDAPGDAGLSVQIMSDKFRLTASWDVLDLPAEPDDTEAADADAADLPVGMSQTPPAPQTFWEAELGRNWVTEPVERIPLEDVKIMKYAEDGVTIFAHLPEQFQPAFKSLNPAAVSIVDPEDMAGLGDRITRRLRDVMTPGRGASFHPPEPDREAIAARLKQQWTGFTPGL